MAFDAAKLGALAGVLEEFLVAAFIAVVTVTVTAGVTGGLADRSVTPFEVTLYKSVGMWPLTLVFWLEVALLVGVPIGILCGVVFSERALVYTSLPAIVALLQSSLLAKSKLPALAAGAFIAASMLASAAIGCRLSHFLKFPKFFTVPRAPVMQLLGRAGADIALFIVAVANWIIWADVISGNERAQRYTGGFFAFILVPLVSLVLLRYLLRERREVAH